ncbi:MAG: hypothetical protein ACYCT1_02220 [Steroidobacteraceae bacterium]
MIKEGKELGRAIKLALQAAGLASPSDAAREFGVKAPSILVQNFLIEDRPTSSEEDHRISLV